jgi:hypothetical protein
VSPCASRLAPCRRPATLPKGWKRVRAWACKPRSLLINLPAPVRRRHRNVNVCCGEFSNTVVQRVPSLRLVSSGRPSAVAFFSKNLGSQPSPWPAAENRFHPRRGDAGPNARMEPWAGTIFLCRWCCNFRMVTNQLWICLHFSPAYSEASLSCSVIANTQESS